MHQNLAAISYTLKASQGFTLMEIVVAIAILSVLATIGFVQLGPLRENTDINSARQHMLVTLQLARSQTVASLDDTVYGVHFESDRYVLFKGTTYDANASDNEAHELGSGIEIFDIAVGGGSDVVFNRLDGSTDTSGGISLRLIDDPATTSTITILSSGLVGPAGTVAPTDTRLTDTRHLHFALDWSIQGSTNLTLTFSNPSHVETIPMADHFNEDETDFDWEDTVTVNGNGQPLHIHTHSLDSNNTLLSIHRDRRENDIALAVAIDGQEIVSYTAAGAAAVGADGGTMSVQ
jgi:prepilin-type N-terminal cleavage/methylation domain-containing protein